MDHDFFYFTCINVQQYFCVLIDTNINKGFCSLSDYEKRDSEDKS